ncbi:MAG: DUF998 domain-containing protein [Dehalococcoidia bacterium]|nr:DUF998 domain-containing protein [Dehalococcoidia bacterium]
MPERLTVCRTAAIAGIVGPAVFLVGDVVASLSTPNYSFVRDSISSLALTPIGWLQTIAFLSLGVLMEVFVAGLFFSIRRARGFHLSMGLLVACGFGMLMIAAFHMDPSGSPRTIEGTIHSATASSLAVLFPVALLSLTPSLKGDPDWRGLFPYTLVASLLALALTVGLLLLPSLSGWFGLYERIMVGNVTIWVAVAAVHLLRISLRRVHSSVGS